MELLDHLLHQFLLNPVVIREWSQVERAVLLEHLQEVEEVQQVLSVQVVMEEQLIVTDLQVTDLVQAEVEEEEEFQIRVRVLAELMVLL
jgi:tRNA(Ser,Leu) C12 N-acetylase TAN1